MDVPERDEKTAEAADAALAARHLEVLRNLLARDYLSRADWSYALRDVAEMARLGLHSSEALVATRDAEAGRWTAVTSDGRTLDDQEISERGSRSVLEYVRAHERPLLTMVGRDPRLTSASVDSLAIEFVLAVPLWFWDVTKEHPVRQLGGCLYVHRTAKDRPFTDADVALIEDITRIAEPTLNLLSHLKDVTSQLAASHDRLEELTRLAARLGAFETHDPEFARETLDTLRRAASAQKVSVLILGPTGSGKTHVAQAYHEECPRRGEAFVTLDGAQATSAETLAAELFGYAASSGYANAPPKGRAGKAQLAHKGTLFIDEVAALSPELQQRLLRLLQSGSFSPLGTAEEVQVDVQVIAATNADLTDLVRSGRFREDLYWRLGEITIRLPPLSKRVADIPHLARQFLEKARERYGRTDVSGFSDGALGALLRHDWARAGNIRGLERTVNRAVLLARPGTVSLDVDDVPLEEMGGPSDEPRSRPIDGGKPKSDEAQRVPDLDAVKAAIRLHGSGTAAAKALGITRDTLVWRLRKVGLTIEDVLSAP